MLVTILILGVGYLNKVCRPQFNKSVGFQISFLMGYYF